MQILRCEIRDVRDASSHVISILIFRRHHRRLWHARTVQCWWIHLLFHIAADKRTKTAKSHTTCNSSFVLCTGECRACVHRASSLPVFTWIWFHFMVRITFLLNITTDASAVWRCLSLPFPPTVVLACHDGIIAYTNFTFSAYNNAK